MPIAQQTVRATESDLESRIHEAIKRAFPWLEPGSIQHQTKFSFTFGRTTLDVDGARDTRNEARTDILLRHDDQPLAILELKRPEGRLIPADKEQGLSYARMLHPSPPLVVVTNGTETQFFETYTGEPWSPEEPSEQEVANLLAAASQVAAADMKRAMDVLLSPKSDLWVEAVRGASRDVIGEMTGTLEDSLLPFAKDFLIPRAATEEVLDQLERHRLVILEGTPLSGKSNVLRELVTKTADSRTLAVLYLEAGAGHAKVLQQLANLLSGTLGWPVSVEEIRFWLRNLSLSQGPDLVIAVDSLGSDRDAIYAELEELTNGFGVKLKIVIAVDDTVAEQLVMSRNRRTQSAIGRKAVRVRVGPLSDNEYADAMGVFEARRIGVFLGGQEAEEYRSPWVLRAVVAGALKDGGEIPEGAMHLVPSLLGTELIDQAREVFGARVELRRWFHKIACAVLEDAARTDRSADEILLSVLFFLVRRSTLEEHLDAADIQALNEQGLIREFLDPSGETRFSVRLPELLAAELATEISNRVVAVVQSGENPAEWLSHTSRLLPFGDIIGAQAILDSVLKMNGIPVGVLLWFLKHPSTQKTVVPGTAAKMFFPGIGSIDVDFKPNGMIQLVHGAANIQIDTGEEEFGSMSDPTNWLILSHVAAFPLGALSQDGHLRGRIDQELLLEIGSTPFVLRRVGSDGFASQLTHTIPGHGEIVCHSIGFIEPIVMAIYRYLSREGVSAGPWIEAAIDRNSLPLLYRIYLVLDTLESSTDAELAEWSSSAKRERVEPALSQFPYTGCDRN